MTELSTEDHQENQANGDPSSNQSSSIDMKIDPSRASTLSQTLSSILTRISSTSASLSKSPRLVAVSKLKPATDILSLHQKPHEHLHFGENYYQELLTKSQLLPKTIRWHFIGALQTNKCKPLAQQILNLWCVESVDTRKKAEGLQMGREKLAEKLRQDGSESDGGEEHIKLRVFVQVNTSGEAEKSGVEPDGSELVDLCRFIRDDCYFLQLQGLMTIGAIARSQASREGSENEDFIKLRAVRDRVIEKLEIPKDTLELSMGMSDDFESAIRCGSDEVRVGSTIFGERPPKNEAQI